MKRPALALLLAAAGCAPAATPARTAPAALPQPVKLPPIVEEALPNGMRVLVIEDRELPVVSMTLLWSVGAEVDPAEKAGLASLAAQLLRQGTRARTPEAIAEAIDSIGGSLEGSADLDSTRVGAQVLARDFDLALALLADVATDAQFPEEEIADLKRQLIAEVRQAHDDPSELGRRHLRRLVYGPDHPYARFPTERSIASIERTDLLHWQRTRLRPDVATLAIAGDVRAIEVLPNVRTAFGTWARGDGKAPLVLDVQRKNRRILLVDKPDLTQSFIRLAHPGIKRSDRDYHPAILANYILGGGTFSSRLLRVLRSEEGKTYGVGSGFTIHKGLGPFGVTTSTRTEETVATLEIILSQMEKIRVGGVTDEELAAAKKNLIGSYPSHFETPQDVTGQVLAAGLLGVPLTEVEGYRARVAKVTRAEVNLAAKNHFRPDLASIVIVGNASLIRGPIEAKYGPVEVVKWTDDI